MSKSKNNKEKEQNSFDITTVSFAYMRNLEVTPGVMDSIRQNVEFNEDIFDTKNSLPVIVEICTKRNPISHEDKVSTAPSTGTEGKKVDSRILNTSEVARLATTAEFLRVRTTIMFKKLQANPYMCDNPEIRNKMIQFCEDLFSKQDAIKRLSRRVAYQIVSGNLLFRNKTFADNIGVRIFWKNRPDEEEQVLTYFGDTDLPEVPVLSRQMRQLMPEIKDPAETFSPSEAYEKFVDAIASTMSGEASSARLSASICMVAKMHPGQNVYPSQSANLAGKEIPQGSPVRVYQRCEGMPVISADKIANVLRKMDWTHGLSINTDPSIDVNSALVFSVEPAGGTLDGYFVRGEKSSLSESKNFYDYKNAFFTDGLRPSDLDMEEQIYLLCCFLRGGVFAPKKPEKEEEDNKTQTKNDNDNS